MKFSDLWQDDGFKDHLINAYRREGALCFVECRCGDYATEQPVLNDGVEREGRCPNCGVVYREQWVEASEGEVDAEDFPLLWNLGDVDSSHEEVLTVIAVVRAIGEATE